jgi:hypothetical protein
MYVKHQQKICKFTCDFPKIYVLYNLEVYEKYSFTKFLKIYDVWKNIFKCMLNNEVMNLFF